MFSINEDMSIYVTRGDVIFFAVGAKDSNGEQYIFRQGDVVRFKVTPKKNCDEVVLQKDFPITGETSEVSILLTEDDTKIGKVISKPTDFWYEVELNPFTEPQTIIGYDDEDGAKLFRLYPEGADVPPYEPTEEDIPVVDEELSMTSERPVQNQAVTRAVTELGEAIDGISANVANEIRVLEGKIRDIEFAAAEDEAYIRGIAESVVAGHNGEADAHGDMFAQKNHNHTDEYAGKTHTHSVLDIIDPEKLIQGAKIVTGSYIGDGKYGREYPTKVDMEFEPKVVMVGCVTRDEATYMALYFGGESMFVYDGNTWTPMYFTYDSATKVMSWYKNSTAASQLNEEGQTYYYTAIG